MKAEQGVQDSWVKGNCNNERANDFPTEVDGKKVTTLAGWSLGRLGPIYFLEQSDSREKNINYIVLFDPGNNDDYTNTEYCDVRQKKGQPSQSHTIAEWLGRSSNNHLVIFAGEVTRDQKHPTKVNNRDYFHSGIQDVLFPEVRKNDDIRDQVTVCNYDSMKHENVYLNFRSYVNKSKITSPAGCPKDPTGKDSVIGWQP